MSGSLEGAGSARGLAIPSDMQFFISLEGEDGEPRLSPCTPPSRSPPIRRSHVEERLERRRSASSSLSSSPAEARRGQFLEARKSRLADRTAVCEGRRHQRSLMEAQREADLAQRLSSSLASAEEKRSEMQMRISRAREERSRRIRETVAEARRRAAREVRESWGKIRERDFVIQFRRERLRYVPRSKVLEAQVEGGETLSEAATLIQVAWGRGKMRPLVANLLRAGLYEVEDFERMKEIIMDRQVIAAAVSLVSRMVRCDPVAETLLNASRSGRILLTAILLDRFGQEVMPEASPEELTVLEHAARLSETLWAYLCHPERRRLLAVTERWSVFSETFALWQAKDRDALVKHMQQDYLTLSEIAAKLGEAARQEWMPHVNRHQARLRRALIQVAGCGAVNELEERLQGLQIAVKPSANVSEQPDLAAPADPANLKAVGETLVRGHSVLSNATIAHELMVDQDFNFKRLMEIKTGQAYAPLHASAQLSATLGDGSSMEAFLAFVLSIKQQLLEMLQNKGPIAQALTEGLEEDLLWEQHRHGSLEPFAVLQFLVVDCMAKMCAPARDESLQQLAKDIIASTGPEGLVGLCIRVAGAVMMMHEDLANFALKAIKPKLASVIVAYERDHFARSTPSTAPLKHARDLARQSLQRQSATEPGTEPRKPLELIYDVVAEGILSLLGYAASGGAPACSIDEHELLFLDRSRLHRFVKGLGRILTVSVLELALRSLGHPAVEETITRCNVLLSDGADDSEQSILAEVKRDVTDAALASSLEAVVGRVVRSTSQDPIAALVRRRIGTLLRTALSKRGEGEPECKPAAILRRNGLSETVIADFTQLVGELARMYRLHAQVYAPIYNSLLE